MEKHKRIYWERGLDITPEIFITTDNFHLSQQCLIARLHAFRCYGILPNTTFTVTPRIVNDHIVIDELLCTAVTPNGYLIDIQNDVVFKEVNLQELDHEEHYVVLQVEPFQLKPIEDNQPYSQPAYQIAIHPLHQHIENGIPILKICYDRNSWRWEIEENYVAPCVCIATSNILAQKYAEAKEEVSAILEKLSSDQPACFQGKLMEIELKNYSLLEYPSELLLLLKKTVAVFKMYLEKMNHQDEMLMTSMEKFIHSPYNHNDILPLLQTGINCLREINQGLDEKPEPVVVKPIETEEILGHI